MKRQLYAGIAAIGAVLALSAFDTKAEGLSYPGNTWGTIVYTGSKLGAGEPRLQTQGIFEQGVDWFRFGDNMRFNTYGALEYVIDSNDTAITPVLGLKINKRFTDGSLDLGFRVKSRNQTIGLTDAGYNSGQKRHATFQLYATYWFDWNLKKD